MCGVVVGVKISNNRIVFQTYREMCVQKLFTISNNDNKRINIARVSSSDKDMKSAEKGKNTTQFPVIYVLMNL